MVAIPDEYLHKKPYCYRYAIVGELVICFGEIESLVFHLLGLISFKAIIWKRILWPSENQSILDNSFKSQ